MKTSARWLALAALLLAGCELAVNPARHGSSGSSAGSNAAGGSSAGTTAGSGGSTGATTASSTTNSASGSGGATTSSASSTTSSGTSSTSTSTTATSTTSATSSSATSSSSGSSGTSSNIGGSSGSSSTSGSSSSSAATSATSTSGSGSSSTSGLTSSSTSGVASSSTTGTASGTISGGGTGTGGTTTTTGTTTGLGSSSGSTGSTCLAGYPSYQGCAVGPPLPATVLPGGSTGSFAPRSEFPSTSEGDSPSPCAPALCSGLGEDDDYEFAVSCYSSPESLTYDNFISVPVEQDSMTGNAFPAMIFAADQYSNNAQHCEDYTKWTDPQGVLTPGSIGVPPAQALMSLLNFHADGGVFDPVFGADGGYLWATAGSNAVASNVGWRVSASDGTFVWTDITQGGQARMLCQLGAQASQTVTDACSYPDGGGDCELFVNDGGTGLRFHLPEPPVLIYGDALQYCDNLGNACGLYRLPSYKELATLVNFAETQTGTFVDGLTGAYWSSTYSPSGDGGIMVIADPASVPTAYFDHAHGTVQDRADHGSVLCVTGP